MDTSKEYIKMCDCPEIQDLWKPKEGEHKDLVWSNWDSIKMKHKGKGSVWIANLNTWAEFCHSNNGVRWYKKFCIWLPRQDQLQEMVKGYVNASSMIVGFNEYLNHVDAFIDYSMEKLWLAFVMKEKFNKTWTGTEWK